MGYYKRNGGAPKGATRKGQKITQGGKNFNRYSNVDPTKQVAGILYSMLEYNTVGAHREMISWVNTCVDELYPRSAEEEAVCEEVVAYNKHVLDEYYIAKKAFYAEKDQLTNDKNIEEQTATDNIFTSVEDENVLEDEEEEGFSLFSSGNDKAENASVLVQLPVDTSTPIVTNEGDTEEHTSKSGNKRKRAHPPKYPTLKNTSRVMELELGMRGIGFLHFVDTTIDPLKVVRHMIETKIVAQKLTGTRSIMRIYPILTSSFAKEDQLHVALEDTLPKWFAEMPEHSTFEVLVERRTKNMEREVLQAAIMKYVPTNRGLRLGKNPDYSVFIQLCGRVVFVGYGVQYNTFGKYNLQMLALQNANDQTEEAKKTPEEASVEETK